MAFHAGRRRRAKPVEAESNLARYPDFNVRRGRPPEPQVAVWWVDAAYPRRFFLDVLSIVGLTNSSPCVSVVDPRTVPEALGQGFTSFQNARL